MISSTLSLLVVAFPVVLGATIDVQVGANGTLAYDPEFVSANAGDVINFIFVPVAAGTSPLPTKQFTVPAGTSPLWFFCGQVGHCGQGMVFAINPPADPAPNSFSAFKALAIAQNGTSSSATVSTTAPSTTSTGAATFTTPPAPQWTSATATVTFDGSTYTTTYSSYAGTPPPTPAAVPVDHRITVGANGALAYSPPNITASIGDTVTFEFHPKNHTVTQSNFLNPCEPLQASTGTTGFKSGFVPVAADATTFPTFQITINDTAPIWGYCGQTGHCAAGMVFSINAVESGPNNFENFLSLAEETANATTTSSGAGSATAPVSSPTSSDTSDAISPRASIPIAFGLGFSGLLALLL
ncbi:hypothetical protein HYPSUDRAFT_148004 [Hypholoma sublateritium FD-334 SS-4]|uniref:Phytocyanin domain-containing protein n=1 Tax=Hypholoma sublateritium (strain FD-334 SS-4) TaxID=945553 RepID=A0A0D2LZD8_HYPSF|nr:hypothetical protein HYPSUDRAFT_148004 [Hypholoma sublateritium FD-334 SS-4]